jgi:hypothetical protein
MLASSLIHPAARSVTSRHTTVAYVGARDGQHTGDLFEDLLGDFGGDLVLGQGVRVSERVVCRVQLAFLSSGHDATKSCLCIEIMAKL